MSLILHPKNRFGKGDFWSYNSAMATRIDFQKFFTFSGLFLIGLNFWAILLAIIGIFYPLLLWIYPTSTFVYLIFLFYRKKISFSSFRISKDFLLAIGFSFVVVLFFAWSTTPSIFSGRDQGSFSASAIQLSQNRKLTFENPASKEFFKIYGPGKALNFPGFNYAKDGKLTTHFPIGYISWLAVFYSFFGLSGLLVANAVTFFFFLSSFYFLLKNYASSLASLAGLALICSSFVYCWFFKLTLSENLAIFLVWFGIWQFIQFFKNRDYLFLFAGIASFAVLAFSRTEAFAFLGVSAIILFPKKEIFSELKKSVLKNKIVLIGSGIFALSYALNILVNRAYYFTIAKGIMGSFAKEETLPGQSFFDSFIYTLKVFNEYAMLDFFLLLVLAILYLCYKKKYAILFPLAFVFPTFIFVFHPGISFDHPWMLRRYIFSVFPACILISVWFLDSFFRRKIYFFLFLGILLLNNLAVSFPYLSFSENKKLLAKTEEISRLFEKNDLVLVDREASGDPFSMLSGPMSFIFQKQAVYFFNPEDLKKIDSRQFKNIYLIIPDKNLSAYQTEFLFDKLLFQADYIINGEKLGILDLDRGELWKAPVGLPKKEKFQVTGKIYLLK
jgi:hypothetical protein